MKTLKGSKTHDNLKAAFAGESQANRRYLYFAAKADVEGQNDVSALFRSTAEGETGHAHGHLEYLEAVGDPATNLPIGRTRDNLKAAVAGETHEYTDMYPGMAKQAISPKPSSRACFAIPGYMSVYSCVSPATAAFRFSRVLPIGRLVAGSPTISRYSRWPCACPVSPSAVERNSAETSLWPSTSAFEAKYR